MQVPGFTQCAPNFFGSNFHTPWQACIEIGARNKSQKVSSRSINSSFNSQVIKITDTAHTFPITYLPSGSTLKWIEYRCIFIGKLRGSSLPPRPEFQKKKTRCSKRRYHPEAWLPTNIFWRTFLLYVSYTFPGVPHCKHSFASLFSELQKEAFHYEYFPLKTGGKMIVQVRSFCLVLFNLKPFQCQPPLH